MGRTFKIQGIDFTVVGVLERLGSAFGNSQDNVAYIPITTFNRLFGPGRSIAIFGRPRPSSGLSHAAVSRLHAGRFACEISSEAR